MAATTVTTQSVSTLAVTVARHAGSMSRWSSGRTFVDSSTVAVFTKPTNRRRSLISTNGTELVTAPIHATKKNLSKPAAMYATHQPEPCARERSG